MIVLTLSSSQPQFTQFLLERFGIEGNMLTVPVGFSPPSLSQPRTIFSYQFSVAPPRHPPRVSADR